MCRLAPAGALLAIALIASPVTGRSAPLSGRATWLWDPVPALTDAGRRTALLEFLEAERIGTVWAQVGTSRMEGPFRAQPGTDADAHGSPRYLDRAPGWRTLIAEAHARGIRFEALDGDPVWALRAYHDAPLAVAEAVLSFNRGSPPEARFDGIHFDIEPYLLISWRFPRSREQLLREFLDLASHIQQHVREEPGIRFGVDIPYWWGSIDDHTGRPIGDTAFNGTRKSADRHLIDMLDNVGVMNYRNKATGPDSIVSNGTAVLEYADQAQKATIWMGVETSLSDPSETWFVAGPPTEVIDERLQNPALGVSSDGRFYGFKVRIIDDGEYSHIGLVAPDGMGVEPTPPFRSALEHLGRRFSASADARFAAAAETHRDRGMWTASRDPEWRDARAVVIEDSESRSSYLGFVAKAVMLPKITFAGLPASALRSELAAAEAAFGAHRSFAGMAIHHVDSFREIVRPSAPPAAPSWRRVFLP